MMEGEKRREMNFIPWGLVAWFLCVTGAVVSSLPQWFIVAFNAPAWYSLVIGLPILSLGAILLVWAWFPERKHQYPDILETTPTPIPSWYLSEEAKKPE